MNLIELVMVIVIVGVLAGAFALPVVSGIDIWETVYTRQELWTEAQYGMERMVREMSCVLDDRSIPMSDPSKFGFTSSATNEWVEFTLQALPGGSLTRNGVSLIGGPWGSNPYSPVYVTGLTFTRYKMDGVVTAPAQPNPYTQIWRIRIDMTVTASNGQSLTLAEEVFPRAFQRENRGGNCVKWQ